MNCKKCSLLCELKQRQFVFHDGTWFTGYICSPCNALYINEKDSIFKYAKQFYNFNKLDADTENNENGTK